MIRTTLSAVAIIALAAGTAQADLAEYSQDFEGLNMASPSALGDDGWLVGANVFNPAGDTFLYNYFAFPAPNGGPAFSAITSGQGGVPQGAQQLVVYNDYNNADHGIGNQIEAVFFREYVIGAGDVGSTWTFSFDGKLGDIQAPTSSQAFIKTLDPNNGFALSNFLTQDTTSQPTTWSSYSLQLPITPGLVGHIFQIGFDSVTSNFTPSGQIYDNINLVPAPGSIALLAAGGLAGIRRRRA